MNPTITIHNVETNEIIERDMTSAEFAEYKLEAIKSEEQEKAKQAIKAAKSALLERLGITAEEAALLLA